MFRHTCTCTSSPKNFSLNVRSKRFSKYLGKPYKYQSYFCLKKKTNFGGKLGQIFNNLPNFLVAVVEDSGAWMLLLSAIFENCCFSAF